MKRVYFFLAYFILILFLLVSCKNVKRDENENSTANESELLEGVEDISESISVFYLFPSPVEILERFKRTDMQYVPDVCNSVENAENYLTSKSKALNLGIYVTDLAYSSLMGRTSEALKYPEVIQSLSADIGISNESFISLIKRIQESISQKDSLLEISNDLYFSMIEYLEVGGQLATVAEISSGAYIESLYIALNSIVVYSDDNPLVKQIIDMKYPFENLLEQAEISNSNESSNVLIEYLNQVKLIFNDLDTDQSETIISENEEGEISIAGGASISMNEDNFIEMKKMLNQIRNKIPAPDS